MGVKFYKNLYSTVKCDFLLDFLMGDEKSNQISDKISGIAPGEIKLGEYFKKFASFRKKRKGKDFPHAVSDEILKLIYNPVNAVPADYYHRTLLESYHFGFIKIVEMIETDENGENIATNVLGWTSPIHEIKIPAKFEETMKLAEKRYNFDAGDMSKLSKAFNLKFFEGVIKKVAIKTNRDMKFLDEEKFHESHVRDNMEKHFKVVLKEMVENVCEYTDEKGLELFIDVDHEIRVNKLEPEKQKRDSARIDLTIRLAMGPNPEHKLRVVIELKKDKGEMKDHSVMKENAKEYDMLDFLDQEETIFYLSASLNTVNNRGKPISPKLSHFLSDNIDAKKKKRKKRKKTGW